MARLELEGLVAGQPFILRSTSTLRPSEITVPVVAPLALPAGYQPLPRAVWRSARFSQRHGSLYFGAPHTVARWAAANGQWVLTTSTVPGSLDVSPFGDEAMLIAAGARQYWRVDPLSLEVTGVEVAQLVGEHPTADDALPTPLSRLVFAADGGAWTTKSKSDGSQNFSGAVLLPIALTGLRNQSDDRSLFPWYPVPTGSAAGVGLLRSSTGQAMLAQHAYGSVFVYYAASRSPLFLFSSTPFTGLDLRAVSDDGNRWLRRDGSLVLTGIVAPGSVHAVVPAGFTVAGHALTGDGRHAVLYLYRLVQDNGQPRARDAAVWVVDIASANSSGLGALNVVAQLPLADAVGCVDARDVDEPCEHEAAMTLGPGELNVFVLGPRAVASVPLPAGLRSQATKGQRPALRASPPVMKPLFPARASR